MLNLKFWEWFKKPEYFTREVNGERVHIVTEDERLADCLAECMSKGEFVVHSYDEDGNRVK